MRAHWFRGLLVGIAACQCLTGLARADQVLSIDGWWNDDFARQACLPRSAPVAGCEEAKIEAVRLFERMVTTAAQANPVCRGIAIRRIAGFKGHADSVADGSRDYKWSLRIFYMEERTTQNWQLFSPPPKFQKSEGDNDAGGLAAAMCAIAKGVGAKIE